MGTLLGISWIILAVLAVLLAIVLVVIVSTVGYLPIRQRSDAEEAMDQLQRAARKVEGL